MHDSHAMRILNKRRLISFRHAIDRSRKWKHIPAHERLGHTDHDIYLLTFVLPLCLSSSPAPAVYFLPSYR